MHRRAIFVQVCCRPPHGGRGLKDIEIAEILIASFSVLWYDAGEEGIKSGKTKDKNRCR